MRNIQFGVGDQYLDRRVSVARGDAPQPEILCTFLGRVQGGAGREFERVIAVRVSEQGTPVVLTDHTAWAHLADSARALPTAGQWEQHFQPWSTPRRHDAAAAAQAAFTDLATAFITQHQEMLVTEQQELDSWFRTRTEELCGPRQRQQANLFHDNRTTPDLPSWQTLADDGERLAAFATDSQNSPRERSEAQVVLELWKRRVADLDKR